MPMCLVRTRTLEHWSRSQKKITVVPLTAYFVESGQWLQGVFFKKKILTTSIEQCKYQQGLNAERGQVDFKTGFFTTFGFKSEIGLA